MSLCPYAYLRVSLSGLLTAPDQGSLTTFGELFNISALDPLLPTLLIATLCLCVLLTILYYSLAVAWEVFWASRRSPSPLDPSAEVVLTDSGKLRSLCLRGAQKVSARCGLLSRSHCIAHISLPDRMWKVPLHPGREVPDKPQRLSAQ